MAGERCWVEDCDGVPEWRIEMMDGGGLVYLACGDADDVLQAIAKLSQMGLVVVSPVVF